MKKMIKMALTDATVRNAATLSSIALVVAAGPLIPWN
jgi:hypothetical protein